MRKQLYFLNVCLKLTVASLSFSLMLMLANVLPVKADSLHKVHVDVESGFQPAIVQVVPGTTVEWRNKEHGLHTVTSDTGAFDSGILSDSDKYVHTFSVPGTYTYKDKLSNFTGTVIVTGSFQPPPSGIVQPPPSNPTPNPVPSPSTLSIGDDFFRPVSLSIAAGTTVTWFNSGQSTHSVTSNTGLFDSGMVRPGQSFSFTFQNAGTYAYYCLFHNGQSGTITVTGNGSPSNPTPSNPTVTPPVTNPLPPVASLPGSLSIGDNNFTPASFAIIAGITVTWVNHGQMPHTVTSDTGLFDSGMIKPSQSFSFTFTAPGTYAYRCLFHNGQAGTITVTGNGSTPNSTPSNPTVTPPVTNPLPPAEPVAESSKTSSPKAITVGDNIFVPAELSVDGGTTIVWTNSGKLPHTVTSEAGLFDSGMLKPGESFSFTFETQGTYVYHCIYHAGQTGTIAVTAGKNPTGLVPAAMQLVVDKSQGFTITDDILPFDKQTGTPSQEVLPVARENRLSMPNGLGILALAVLVMLEACTARLIFLLWKN